MVELDLDPPGQRLLAELRGGRLVLPGRRSFEGGLTGADCGFDFIERHLSQPARMAPAAILSPP
jgi:hypothetical protein